MLKAQTSHLKIDVALSEYPKGLAPERGVAAVLRLVALPTQRQAVRVRAFGADTLPLRWLVRRIAGSPAAHHARLILQPLPVFRITVNHGGIVTRCSFYVNNNLQVVTFFKG